MLNYEELISKLDLDKEYVWTVIDKDAIDGSRGVIIGTIQDGFNKNSLYTSLNTIIRVIENIDVDDPNNFMRFVW